MPSVQWLPIRGQTEHFPVNRIFCVGRNHHANAVQMSRPWDRDIEQGSVCTEIVPMPGVVIEHGAIALQVNGASRQSSDVDKLNWSIREIIAELSTCYQLQLGDPITGRAAGVAAVALILGAAE